MINSQVFMKKIMLMSIGVLFMTVLVTTAKADDSVTRTHDLDLEGIEEIEFNNSVGSFEVVLSDSDDMGITVEIEGQKKGFFRRTTDVSGMDIEVEERGNTLFITFEEKKANADWFITLPRTANLDRMSVDMGVGEVEMEIGETELDVELGVGEVFVQAPGNSVGRVYLNVGVGEASLRGGEIIEDESAFISSSVRGEGNGNYDIEVDVGVGDVDIRLN